MPLKEASWAVVVIWSRMLLYWVDQVGADRLRVGSCTGAPAVSPSKALPAAAAVPPIVPIVEEAASLVVVIVITPSNVDRGLQVVGRQRGVQVVQALDLPLVPCRR